MKIFCTNIFNSMNPCAEPRFELSNPKVKIMGEVPSSHVKIGLIHPYLLNVRSDSRNISHVNKTTTVLVHPPYPWSDSENLL